MKRQSFKFASILTAIAMLVNLFLLPALSASANGASDEYDELRARLYDVVTGGDGFNPADPDIAPRIASIDELAETFWSTMDTSPGRTYLWSELASPLGPSMQSNHVSGAYDRLMRLSIAYSTRGSAYYGNADLLEDILSGMDWMYENRYNTSVPKRGYGNWYDWQIASPLSINNISVLLYDHLTPQQLANWHAVLDWQALALSAGNVGANRVWSCNILITSGIITKNSAKIQLGVSSISPVLPYVKSGEGTYEDGSFVMHTALIAYNGGYGVSMLDNLTKVMAIVAGSSWDFTDPNLNNIYDWVYNSFEPLFYDNSMMTIVTGRNIARIDSNGITSIGALGSSVVRLAYTAPNPADAARFKSMVKQWMLEATSPEPYNSLGSIQLVAQTKAIMDDASIEPRGELVLNRQYPSMARAVHRRPDFAFAVGMHSDKIGNYELINGENLKGWHTGAGMTYLYNGDLTQYLDAFWPTVNSHRLPGTTIVRDSETPPHLKNGSNWAGGTEVGGLYGVTGMHYVDSHSSVSARKSWFMFDDEIVSLGADIRSTNGAAPVETIVDNRKLNEVGDNALTLDGEAKSSAIGWSETLDGAAWAHLAGNAPGSDVGYYFPGGGAGLKGLRESRTASWNSINTYFTDPAKDPAYFEDHTRNYVNLWFDHGTAPSDGSYAYVLLPNKSASQTGSYSASPDIDILENSAEAQAVRENGLGATGINFWQDAAKTVAGVTSNKKASVMLRSDASGTELSVTDPTMANKGTIELTLDMELGALAYLDPGVSVGKNGNATTVSVNVNGAGGASFKTRFLAPGMPSAGPESPTGLAAGNVTDHSATVSWNAVEGADDYRLYRADASTGDFVSIWDLSRGATSYTDTGLASSTHYLYKVAALNESGISADSDVLSVWTVPLAPTDLRVESVTDETIELAWQAVPGATGYDVFRSESKDGPFAALNVLPIPANAYEDSSIVSGVNYYYQVSAVNPGGTSQPTAAIPSLFGLPAILIEESFDGMASGGLAGQNGWLVGNGGVAANTVTVQNGGGGKQALIATTSSQGSAEAYAMFQAPQGSVVTAEAELTSANNNWKNALVLADGSLASNNSAVHVVMQNGTIWGYNGSAKTDIMTAAPNGTPYRIKVVLRTAARKFDVYVNDALKASGWNYRYSGVGKVDKLSSSIAGNASTLTLDNVRVSYELTAPGNVAATALSESAIGLTWDAVPGAAGYRVYKSSPGNAAFELASPAGLSTQSYHDEGLAAGSAYRYKIVAVHGDALSPESSVATATTEPGEGHPEPAAPLATLSAPSKAALGGPVELAVGIAGTLAAGPVVSEVVVRYDSAKLAFAATENDDGQLELDADALGLQQGGFQVLATGVKPEEGEILVVLARTSVGDVPAGEWLRLRGKVRDDAAAGDANAYVSRLHLSSEGGLVEADVSQASVTIAVKLADTAALEAAIAAAEALLAAAVPGSQPGNYPPSAVQSLDAAISAAKSAAQNETLPQGDVNAALTTLQAAVSTFQSSVISPPVTDKTALAAALGKAQARLAASAEGDKIGQYPGSAIDALEAAIAAAQLVQGNGGATQAQIDGARSALDAAVADFGSYIITLVPGQTAVTIRDLSIIAKYYGTTNQSADWALVEKADLFGNGEISIVELAAVARMIVAEWLAE